MDQLGGQIELIDDAGNEEKSPNFDWNGKLWELKSPVKVKGVDKLVRTGIKQITQNPGGIVVDVQGNEPTIDYENAIIHRVIRSAKHSLKIVILRKGTLEMILQYAKK